MDEAGESFPTGESHEKHTPHMSHRVVKAVHVEGEQTDDVTGKVEKTNRELRDLIGLKGAMSDQPAISSSPIPPTEKSDGIFGRFFRREKPFQDKPQEPQLSHKELQAIKEIKESFPIPTVEGLRSIVDNIEDIPKDLRAVLPLWVQEQWFDFSRFDVGPREFLDRANPRARSMGINGLVAEMAIAAHVKKEELSQAQLLELQKLMLDSAKVTDRQAQLLASNLKNGGSDPMIGIEFKDLMKSGVKDRIEGMKQEGKTLSLLAEKGIGPLSGVYKQYIEMGKEGRVGLRDESVDYEEHLKQVLAKP